MGLPGVVRIFSDVLRTMNSVLLVKYPDGKFDTSVL